MPRGKGKPGCLRPGCPEKHHAKGYCLKHYARGRLKPVAYQRNRTQADMVAKEIGDLLRGWHAPPCE